MERVLTLGATKRRKQFADYSEIMLRFDAPLDGDAAKLLDLMHEIPLDENAIRADVIFMQELRGDELVLSKLQKAVTQATEWRAVIDGEISALPKDADRAKKPGKLISDQKSLDIQRGELAMRLENIDNEISLNRFHVQKKEENIRQAKLNHSRIFTNTVAGPVANAIHGNDAIKPGKTAPAERLIA
jgi:hypothetical protein